MGGFLLSWGPLPDSAGKLLGHRDVTLQLLDEAAVLAQVCLRRKEAATENPENTGSLTRSFDLLPCWRCGIMTGMIRCACPSAGIPKGDA
jgi:hypothetical protein